MGSIEFQAFLDAYLNPDEAYAPVPFWFLNDELEEREIIRQLDDFKTHGLHCVVLHPRIGIPESIVYLSDRFMQGIKYAVQCAHQLSMQVILYDEGMYPSGSACGLVVRENPKYAARCIYPRPEDESPGMLETPLCKAVINGKRFNVVHAPSNGTIRGIHFGQDSHEPNAPLAGDILNPDAVDCFIRLTHERYLDVLGDYFGNTVIGFFTDEPSPMGRYPREGAFAWTWGMEKDYPLEKIPLLWQEGESGNKARAEHKCAVSKRLGYVFYHRLSEWCHKNGLQLTGHPAQPDEITSQQYLDIPGQDLIARTIAPEKDPLSNIDGVMAKLTSDLARQKNKTRNLNEALGVCHRVGNTWDLPFSDAKWMLDHLLSRGCNMLVLHAFYFSLRGPRSGERPPDVGPNTPWWKGYRSFALYLTRLSQLNTGELTAPVTVLCRDQKVPFELVRPLYEQQIDFIYLQEDEFLSSTAHYPAVLYDQNDTFLEETYLRLSKSRAMTKYPFYQPPSPLRVQRMKKHGVSYMTVFNEGNAPAQVDTTGYTQIWLPFEEQRLQLSAGPVVLLPGKTAVLVNAPDEELPVYGKTMQMISLEWHCSWKVINKREILSVSASELVNYRFSAPELQYTDFTTDIELPDFRKVFLSLKIERECAYVMFNGLNAGACLLPDTLLDLTAFAHIGINTLSIRVMATPANYFNLAAIPCGLAAVPLLSYA